MLEQHYQLAVQLKWPNDLYAGQRKLGGILVELSGQTHANCDVVIGIGLNIQMPAQAQQHISQPFTDLVSLLDKPLNRNELIPLLQQSLCETLSQFEHTGFNSFVGAFNQRNVFAGQPVTLSGAGSSQHGICLGVDGQGGLLLEQQGQQKAYYGGELSLRGN